MSPRRISVVVFKEGDFWVAQCLEYDIATQARSLRDLQYELQRTLIGHVVAANDANQVPFAKLAPAPQKSWDMFAAAYGLEYEHHPFRLPDGQLGPEAELRVSA